MPTLSPALSPSPTRTAPSARSPVVTCASPGGERQRAASEASERGEQHAELGVVLDLVNVRETIPVLPESFLEPFGRRAVCIRGVCLYERTVGSA